MPAKRQVQDGLAREQVHDARKIATADLDGRVWQRVELLWRQGEERVGLGLTDAVVVEERHGLDDGSPEGTERVGEGFGDQ